MFTADCDETESRLSDYLEDGLSRWWRLRVSRHLSRCEGCHAVLRSFTTVVEQLQGLGRQSPPAPPISTVQAVVHRIRREAADNAK